LKSKARVADRIVLVAGGKGGVGKTTIAAGIADMHAERHRVGVMDSDISGPSVATLYGLSDPPKVRDGRILPLKSSGVSVVSTGVFGAADKAFAWTGPLLRGALRQLIHDVDWGSPDFLVIDTPPGTNEVHLELLRLLEIDQVVVVTAADPLAAADTKRCLRFYSEAGLRVDLVVENMAKRACDKCGSVVELGSGSGDWAGPKLRLPHHQLTGSMNLVKAVSREMSAQPESQVLR
jgi:ATP-binding protein involved in chromosome partitioning